MLLTRSEGAHIFVNDRVYMYYITCKLYMLQMLFIPIKHDNYLISFVTSLDASSKYVPAHEILIRIAYAQMPLVNAHTDVSSQSSGVNLWSEPLSTFIY